MTVMSHEKAETLARSLLPEEMSRDKKLALIWRHTHADFKGKREDGTKVVLVLRKGGTWSVPLSDLTDDEIADKLPYTLKLEAKRKEGRK